MTMKCKRCNHKTKSISAMHMHYTKKHPSALKHKSHVPKRYETQTGGKTWRGLKGSLNVDATLLLMVEKGYPAKEIMEYQEKINPQLKYKGRVISAEEYRRRFAPK